MSKIKKSKRGHRKPSVMGRSDIPYAKRIAMQQNNDIAVGRNHAAKITMFCNCVALHELEGIGYKRLIRYSIHFNDVVSEFYEDVEVGMAHAKHRMEQMGMPIGGYFYRVEVPGLSKREQEIHDHALQASQIALICSAIAMNDEFGFGRERQERVSQKSKELSARYAKEGEKFLLDKLEEIGFDVADGEALCYMGDDGTVLTPKQWRKEIGHERT